LKQPPVRSLWMGRFNIRLESTKLDDVLKKIKAGEIRHRGDAGDSVYWLVTPFLNRLPLFICG
jgi:hypothetical protein